MTQASKFLATTTIAAALSALYGCGSSTSITTPAVVSAASGFDCAAIAAFALGDNIKVTATDKVEANTVRAGTAQTGDFLPAHCVVQGTINGRTGKAFSVDQASRAVSLVDAAYGIKFELRLPKDWNGRFFFQGGGGLDGFVGQAVGRYNSTPGGTQNALSRGFAVVSTDAGHQAVGQFDGNFGADEQARLDYAYNGVEQATLKAKEILNRYYGKPADKSYFVGCSNGGRQAMLASQRLPAHFDGIVAGNPGFNLTNAAINQITDIQALAAAVPAGATGPFGPDLSTAFSRAESALIGTAIVGKCDVAGRDTAKDGIVSDVEACRFDPRTDIPTCVAGNDGSCLSAVQKTALQSMIAGARTSQGVSLYSDYFYDAGVGSAAWNLWKTDGIPVTVSPTLSVTVGLNILSGPESISKVFSTPAIPGFDPFTFNPDTGAAQTVAFGRVFNATSTDLSAYKARGGKLLIYHGNSDPVFSSKDTIRYYKSLGAANGGDASSFARLFLVPGMAHCSGGPATDNFDALTAIQNWVEQGTAPETIVATASAAAPWPGRTRPLCTYPKVAAYKGAGSLEDAASFSCQ